MTQKVHEVMTENPITVGSETAVAEAARLMRDRDVGDVLVTANDHLLGILTDRDIVVRTVAEGKDVWVATAGEVCTAEVTCVRPGDDTDRVVELMRTRAIRRLPVVDGDRLVGVVSLGDMAIRRDRHSALGEISQAAPNN